MKSKILGLLGVALLAGPMAANASTFNFAGTCNIAPCPAVDSNATGVLVLSDSYVFGQQMTTADVVSFSFTAPAMSFVLGQGGETLTQVIGGLNSDGTSAISQFLVSSASHYWVFSTSLGLWGALDIDNSYSILGDVYSVTPSTVPEPGSLALLGLGLAGLGVSRRRRAV